MPVFRVEKNSNYTTMCNYHLRDQGLSLKGKGLLSMLLSLPDTWNYSVRGLSSITPDGVDGVLTALKELERLGYLERNQQRESNGRMGRAEYVIYEMPRKKPCSESPCTEKPYAVNPDTDTPVTENPAQLSTNRTSTETINKREKKEIWNDEKEIFMMMNFKKNQNNAVCSMDCKNCPHGASQPNPMDDPMFEKSIAMLHNWLMLEAIREDHPKERIVMVILPGAGGELLTEDGSRDIFEDVYDEMEADLVADGELLLHYDKSDVIETDRTRYLLGAAEVSEIDQNGNECSINLFTLERTIDYVNENLTVVSIGGELVPALRLI